MAKIKTKTKKDSKNSLKSLKEKIKSLENDLLYEIKEDMKYFKNVTSYEYIKNHKNIVIMGYNTWKSIPDEYKPLKNRINIIITKNHFNEMKYEDENILIFNDFDFCYKHLKDENDKGNLLGQKFIIGGSQIYNYVFISNFFYRCLRMFNFC